MGINSMKRRG